MSEELFNSTNEAADIIICTNDQKELYTHKVLLSQASTFFRDMSTMPQPPSPEGKVQSVSVSETSTVWLAVLAWIDPRCPVDFEKTTLDDIAILVDPVDKYLMDGIRASLCSILRSKRADYENGLRLWALAMKLKDIEIINALSRTATMIKGSSRRYCKELETLSASSLFKLDEYGLRCSAEVQEMLSGVGEKVGMLRPVRAAATASRLVHPIQPNDDTNHKTCGALWKFIDDSGEYRRSWLNGYLVIILKLLKERPCKGTIQTVPSDCFNVLRPAFSCDLCSKNLVENLEMFNAKLGDILEEAISKVKSSSLAISVADL